MQIAHDPPSLLSFPIYHNKVPYLLSVFCMFSTNPTARPPLLFSLDHIKYWVKAAYFIINSVINSMRSPRCLHNKSKAASHSAIPMVKQVNNSVARINVITQVASIIQNHPVLYRGKRREIKGNPVMCEENSIIVTRSVKTFKSLLSETMLESAIILSWELSWKLGSCLMTFPLTSTLLENVNRHPKVCCQCCYFQLGCPCTKCCITVLICASKSECCITSGEKILAFAAVKQTRQWWMCRWLFSEPLKIMDAALKKQLPSGVVQYTLRPVSDWGIWDNFPKEVWLWSPSGGVL